MKINGSRRQFYAFVLIIVAVIGLSILPSGNILPCHESSGYVALQSSFTTCHEQLQATIAMTVFLPVGMIFAVCAVINRIVHIREHATRSIKTNKGRGLQ